MNWATRLKWTVCPSCGEVGHFARHAHYQKYHYKERIEILRVRCRLCRRTHAVMPSFSLPGTSIGTAEVEQYLTERERGLSRSDASGGLLERGVSAVYPKHLEWMLDVAVNQGKGLFPKAADSKLSGLAWIQAVCGPTKRPLLALNLYCLRHKTNAICFCRSSILQFARSEISGKSSQNIGSPATGKDPIDSG